MTKQEHTSERGASLVETMALLALATILLAAAANFSLQWSAREEMRGSIYSVQTYLQTARMQAVSRNRSCQFRIDTATRRLQVFDLNDPANSGDDILLSQTTLSPRVSLSRPDTGDPVTLALVSGTTYQATFAPSGIVTSGTGLVSIFGGSRFHRIDLFAAGATKIWNWDGASWVAGW